MPAVTGVRSTVIAKALECLAVMTAGTALPLSWMWFWMETMPDLAAVARLTVRAARVLFLAIGWVAVVVRLLL